MDQVEGEPGRAPRAFTWRGKRCAVAEVLQSRYTYGTGRATAGRVWLPRGRQAYYCLRTEEGDYFELCAERSGDVEEWFVYRLLSAPPPPEEPSMEARREMVGVGRPKPTLPPPHRIIAYQPSLRPWRDLLLRLSLDQPASLLPHAEPRIALGAEYGRLMVGLIEAGEPLLGGAPGSAEVHCLCVLPAFRRLGMGTALLKEVQAWAARSGYQRLEAAAPVSDESGASDGLLRSNRMPYHRTVLVVRKGEAVEVVAPAQYWAQWPAQDHVLLTVFAIHAMGL